MNKDLNLNLYKIFYGGVIMKTVTLKQFANDLNYFYHEFQI